MTENQFWRLTPGQFFALVERNQEIQKTQDRRFGSIVATIMNLFIDKKKKAVSPLRAMGYPEEELEDYESVTRTQSEAETALRFRLLEAGMKRVSNKKGR